MPFDEYLAERIRKVLDDKNVDFEAKKMMGGLTFMVGSKMCVGIVKDNLMARIGPDAYFDALKIDGCSEMNFTGRAMKGYVFIDPIAVDMDADLEYWVQLCLDYNPMAKSSKSK